MDHQATDGSNKSCPCKKIPLALSTFTAASFGDLHRLTNKFQAAGDDGTAPIGAKHINKTDEGGSTVLHLAAQHGHVAITAMVLQMGAKVDGVESPTSFTPLHRASFSGAVATMKLLIDAGADLMARDRSFGDQRTPLHKAVAGGRYLAVQLLLDALSARGMLSSALEVEDRAGMTPLQLAYETSKQQQEERISVQRWDQVAGSSADWEACTQLLKDSKSSCSSRTKNKSQQTLAIGCLPCVPQHLQMSSSALNCLACGDSSGQCLTTSWEMEYRSGLFSRMGLSIKPNNKRSEGLRKVEPTTKTSEEKRNGIQQQFSVMAPRGTEFLYGSATETRGTDSPRAPSLGQPCDACGVPAIALFRSKNQSKYRLVCKRCRNR